MGFHLVTWRSADRGSSEVWRDPQTETWIMYAFIRRAGYTECYRVPLADPGARHDYADLVREGKLPEGAQLIATSPLADLITLPTEESTTPC